MTGATGCGRWGYIAVAAGASLALEGALVTMARKSIPNNLKQQLETDWPVGFQLCFKLAVMRFLGVFVAWGSLLPNRAALLYLFFSGVWLQFSGSVI